MSTNQPYVSRSMNGIITIDDGAGGTMEDGVVTCLELDVPRINVDQIESRTVGANVSLFTELVGGSIHLGSGSTTLFVDAPTTVTNVNITNLAATNISTNNIVSAVPTTAVNLFANQTAGMSIGTAIGFGAMLIGGASQTGQLTIRNTGIMNLGVNSSSVNIGTSHTALKTVNIGAAGYVYINGVETNVSGKLIVTDILAPNSSSTANLYTNVSTGTINIGTQMWTSSNINIGKQGLVNFSNSTINSAGGINASNLFCDNFRHEVYGTNVSLLLEEFGTGATIQMGNVSNRLILYAPMTIVDSLKVQTIISPNPTILSDLFTNNTSGNVSIATGLTTGVLTMGGAGAVNIKGSAVNISTLNTSSLNVSTLNTNTITATNTSSNAVIYNNITTGSVQLAMNTSSITIGANSTKVAIGLNASVEMAGLTINGAEIRTIGFGSALTIGGSNMSSTQIVAVGTSQNDVYLGSVAVGAKVFVGDFKFTDDTMNIIVGSTPNVSGTMKIGDALTVGSLQLGTNLTTGNVSIGNGGTTGNINIRTTGALLLANSASSIELGTTPSITNNINLGNVSTTINVNSATTNISGKLINVGVNTGVNQIYLGNASTSVLSIGTTMATIGSSLNLGSTALSTLAIKGSAINIGIDLTANAISIGNISGALNVRCPINPTYDALYTLNVGTPSGCIGNYITADVNNSGAITSGTAKDFNVFTNLPIGVWMLYYQQVFTCPTTNCALTASLQMRMGTTSLGADIGVMYADSPTAVLTVGNTKSYLFTQIYTNTAATTDVYFNIYTFFTGTLSGNLASVLYVKALRLA
jgi:hypothetical protein